MTTLDPSHLPWLASNPDPSTGQAVLTSVPKAFPKEHLRVDLDDVDDDSLDGRRGWRRRNRYGRNLPRRAGPERIPMPPIPDQRFEQGFLLSLSPFIKPRTEKLPPPDQEIKATETVAMVHAPRKDIYAGSVSIQWPSVMWIIFRDHFMSPLLQGALWGALGLTLKVTFSRLRNR